IEVDYQQTTHGHLPRSWVSTVTVAGRTISVARLQVEKLELEPAVQSSDFDEEGRDRLEVDGGKTTRDRSRNPGLAGDGSSSAWWAYAAAAALGLFLSFRLFRRRTA